MFAAGVDAIGDLSVAGIFWIVSAAILALFARIRLRAAEGFKPRPVKSGELFKQSFAMAQRMGIPLKGIFVVPAGRGQLMNAFSLPGHIGMTDICVHRIKGAQRDFFIGHELAHNQLRHGWKKLRIVAGTYLIMAALSFFLPHLTVVWQVLLRFGLILIPLMVSNAVARRFEFAADRAAVEVTEEPEAAIRALGALYYFSGVPARLGSFQELFLTPPSLGKRINAIARVGNVSVEKVNKIRRQFDEEAERLAVRI
jgi:Zn-dependent protease with chaperone function